MPAQGRQRWTWNPLMRNYSSVRWSSWQVRLAMFLGALVLFGVVDMHVYMPRLSIHRGDDSLTVKHMGWDRMSLDPMRVSSHFQGMLAVPGNKLQPVDVLKGSRDASLHQDEARPSPYRSEGAMKPYTGDLARPGTLQQALEARSHKKEVILVHFREREMGMALNMVLNLRKLTFEHFLLLTLDEASCQRALQAFPKAGCVWSTYLGNGELEYFGAGTADHHNAHERLILIRYHTIARMIRAGYNVLSVHADAHFSDDPYAYVKRPPLSKAALVTMSQGGWAALTTGFLYIQNADVAGPVSWIFTEAVARILRYAEVPEFVEVEGSQKTLAWAIGDEDILRDAVASAYLGRPVAWHSLWSEGRDGRGYSRGGQDLNDVWQAHAALAIKDLVSPGTWKAQPWKPLGVVTEGKAVYNARKVRMEDWVDSLGEDIQSRLGVTGGHFERFNLTIPREPAQWDAELGGDPFPAKTSQVSMQWSKTSSIEISTLTGSSWDRGMSEVLVQPLMYGKFMEYGHNGIVNGAFYVKPRPFFFAHVIGIRAYLQGRAILMKAVGMWHWEATQKLEMLEREHQGKAVFPTLSDKRVLSFTPDVLPLHFDNEADFRAAVMGLVQLAVATKRTPVWPDLACNSLWLDDEEAAAHRGRSGQPKKWMAEDWRGDIEIVPRLPLDGPPSTHRCLVWYFYEEACDMQGMSLMDFFHLRDHIWPAHAGNPTVNNTVLLEGIKELRTEADVAWLKKDLDAMAEEPAVYLGKPVRVKTLGIESEAERRLQSLQEECLDSAFHISMDRVNYRASDRGQVQEEQEEVLQELKDLENPEAAAREKAAAEEAAKLLQTAGQQSDEEQTLEEGRQERTEEKRLVMQAMHVPHEDPGKAPTGGKLLGGAQALGSPQSLGTGTDAQEAGQDPDMSTPVDEGLPLEPGTKVGADVEEEGAQEDEDPEIEQIEKEAAAEKERERALKRRQEAVARVAKEEQENLELALQAEEARQRQLEEERQREKERELELARQRIREQEDLDLASAGGNLLGTEELGFHDNPEDPTEDVTQESESIEEGVQAQTGDNSEKEAEISRDDDREARYARMGEGPADGQQREHAQQADRAEQSQGERRRMLLQQARLSVRGASALKHSAAAGESSSEGRWPKWPWKASREDILEMTGLGSQQHKGSSPTRKTRQWSLHNLLPI